MSFSEAAARLKKLREEAHAPAAAPEGVAPGAPEKPPDRPVDFQELYLLRARIVGVLIRDARLAHSRSLEACAEAVGVNPDTLLAWELGESSPALPQLELLAQALGVPVSHFWSTQTLTGQAQSGPFPQEEYVEIRQRVIGALLRKARTDAGLSLDDLAARCGIPAERLTAYELGTQPIPMVELLTLSSATHVSLRLFLDDASRIGHWLEMQEDFKRFGELSEEQRAFVSNPINASFVELAIWLSRREVDELRGIAESILNLSRLNMDDLRRMAEDILNITL